MKVLRQIVLVAFMVLPLVSPAMACVLPDAQMTAAERSCCTDMKGQCGAANMPKSHSCCRQDLPGSGYRSMAYANTGCALAVSHGVALVPVAAVLAQDDGLLGPSIFRREPEPPQSPPPAIFILKI